jgi:hypothetical protein
MIDYQALAETANPGPAHKVTSGPEVKSWKQRVDGCGAGGADCFCRADELFSCGKLRGNYWCSDAVCSSGDRWDLCQVVDLLHCLHGFRQELRFWAQLQMRGCFD